MTDLRHKIAAVQRQHRLGRSVVPGHDPGYICECGWRSDEPDCTWTDHPEHVADAVIAELGLREETVAFANGPLNGFKGGPYDGCTGNGVNRRYVTQWERR